MGSFTCSLVVLIAFFSLLAGCAAASEEGGGLRRSAESSIAENSVDEGLAHNNDRALGMTWIEPEELPLDILQQQSGRDLQMMGCDRGGADDQKMIFFGKNFGTCSTMDRCLQAAMPIQMAYYCPKYGRPACGGQCLSLINGDCSDGVIRDKEGGTHNFRTEDKFWRREAETWGFGTGRPIWPANFGGGSCAYDYSALFTQAAAPVREFTFKKRKMKKCSWLAGLPRTSIQNICKTRFKLPAARSACYFTCQAANQVSRVANPADLATEANNEYLHREKSKKTCNWLQKQDKRAAICSKNKNARGRCADECS